MQLGGAKLFGAIVLTVLVAGAAGFLISDQSQNEVVSTSPTITPKAIASGTASPAVSTSGSSDRDLVVKIAEAETKAVVGNPSGATNFRVDKISSDFALVRFDTEGGATGMLLKKVNGYWVSIVQAQGGPEEKDMKSYGVPTDFTWQYGNYF